MVVQAQYPSNILFFNRHRQEGHEFSLQQQAGGVFLDQSHSYLCLCKYAQCSCNPLGIGIIGVFSDEHRYLILQKSSPPCLICSVVLNIG
ncbi:hypothetical protein V6N13_094949 [Hibiscus sabdariffa]|uniref:Uncharacterized protein n=1 Tax=Hibiscus sabdariffa TaxID=183260 RepID=A0ABR2PT37_9ROSI